MSRNHPLSCDTVDTLIIGSDGFMGSALMKSLSQQGFSVTGTSRRDRGVPALFLDLADSTSQWQLPESVGQAVICAGITDIVECQRDPSGTRMINIDATCRLIDELQRRDAHLLYLSSNLVFNSAIPNASVDLSTDCRCEYGCQKVAVEEHLVNSGCSFQSLRLGKVIDGTMDIIDRWRTLHSKGGTITPYEDLYFSPVPLGLVEEVVRGLLRTREQGFFHLSAEDELNYLELAKHWGEHYPGVKIEGLKAAEREGLGFLSRRHAALDSSRLVELLGIELPSCASLLSEMTGISRSVYED